MNGTRLRRSTVDRMIFGVCGGLANYFELDSTLVRVIFVVLALASGVGIVAYLLLAILMPQEGTVAQTPRETVRENVSEMGTGVQQVGEQIRSGWSHETIEGAPEYRPRDRRPTAGVILIVIGALILLSNLGLFWWLEWGRTWPVLLILIGLWIIWRRGGR